MSDVKQIAIIGGGFSGALLAVNLIHQARVPVDIHLIERTGKVGLGLAYATDCPVHLLNVRASNMSAFPDDPTHFLQWLWRRSEKFPEFQRVPPSGQAFVPRHIFGAYIQDVLAESARRAHADARFIQTVDEAIDVRRENGRFTVSLASGKSLSPHAVALCIGNFPPSLPAGLRPDIQSSPRYIGNPWDAGLSSRIGPDDHVFVIGTALTMVDYALLLRERGFNGRITALSRHGLLSRRHAEAGSRQDFLKHERWPTTISGLWRRIRQEIRLAADMGDDWRAVIDAVRPHTQRVWWSLSDAERRRFLRHARVWWEVHRHRMAPQVADQIDRLRVSGHLSILAGRLTSLTAGEAGVDCVYRPRGQDDPVHIRADWVVNCAGPQTDFGRHPDHLVQSLTGQGLIRPDPLGLGIDVTHSCNVIDRNDNPVAGLYALGPPTRSRFWEITAVPDIRTQCAVIADHLLYNEYAVPAYI